jgi:hypothetical protein
LLTGAAVTVAASGLIGLASACNVLLGNQDALLREGGADAGGDTASKDAPSPDHVDAEHMDAAQKDSAAEDRVADVPADTITVKDSVAETCVPESDAAVCGLKCVGSVPNGCGGMIDCTTNPCACDESSQKCVFPCVPDGDSVLSDCTQCCSTICSGSGTTCCIRKNPMQACGTLCAGFAPDGCVGTVDCTENDCTTCANDMDCSGHACDVTRSECVLCVRPVDAVEDVTHCADCCSGGCSTGTMCSY